MHKLKEKKHLLRAVEVVLNTSSALRTNALECSSAIRIQVRNSMCWTGAFQDHWECRRMLGKVGLGGERKVSPEMLSMEFLGLRFLVDSTPRHYPD